VQKYSLCAEKGVSETRMVCQKREEGVSIRRIYTPFCRSFAKKVVTLQAESRHGGYQG
jgi:hypothetical protein